MIKTIRLNHLILSILLFFLSTKTQAQQSTFDIINLGDKINSASAELNPIISVDGKRIYFVRSNHPENNNPTDGQDIWMSTKDEFGNWTPAILMDKQLNSQQYNTVFYVNTPGNKMLIGGYFKDGIYWGPGFSFVEKINDNWGTPYPLQIKHFDKMFAGVSSSVYMTADNNVMILSFSEQENGKENDLYVCTRIKENKWSQPIKINSINTTYDESTPFLAADGVSLYFSSNRPGGFGKNDIYLTKRLDDSWKNWSEPINLGAQINTDQWDGYYTLPASGNVAYMVSYKNTLGKADIVEIKLHKDAKPNPVALVKGKILDGKTNNKIVAEFTYEELPNTNPNSIKSFWSKSGEFQIVLPYGKNYSISTKAAGYLPASLNIDLTNPGSYNEIEKDLIMLPIETGQILRLNNIFFDEYSATLKEESKPELNRMVKLLKEKPELIIEISGHTDAVGDDNDNQILSEKRAASVKDYLIAKGIKPNRLQSVGYGETQPIADNNNDIDRQQNRRVEFKILKK